MIQQIHEWALTRADIRLAVIIGSRARTDRPADSLSDLDLLLFTTDVNFYLTETAWLGDLGVYHLTFLEKTAVGDFVERRVLFEHGLDVDFIPLPAHLMERDLLPEMEAVFKRGYRVLVDKDGLSQKLQLSSRNIGEEPSVIEWPSNDSFLHLVNDFLYHGVWSAKKLCRGELWTAKMCCDGYMKRQLLQAVKWQRYAAGATSVDTWHEGRFLDSWAHPQVLAELRGAFATYEVDSVWQALTQTVHLFGHLCKDVADRLGYSYPSKEQVYVLDLIREYQSIRDRV